MIAVIQRVLEASVTINKELKSEIGKGLLILLGVAHDDEDDDLNWLVAKISKLRIFSDAEEKMNLSIQDMNGEVLVVSQFTLFASTKKGNRPSFTNAAIPDKAIPMYERFVQLLSSNLELPVKTGLF